MALRRQPQRGMIRDSVLLALAGSTSTGLLAQIASGGSPEALGIFAGLGVNGLLIFLLSQANKREVEQARAFSTELRELSKRQAELSERLLSTVIGLLPAEKGSKK